VPAIGLTLLAFLVVRVGVEMGLRPRYLTPVTVSVPFGADAERPAFPVLPTDMGWTISLQTLDAQDRVISDGVGFDPGPLQADCPELGDALGRAPSPDARPATGNGPRALAACVQRMGLHVVAVYQPADRYWRFQLTEAGIYVVLAAALVGGSAWWVRHRVS
jgi:hypothetical protein